MAKRVKYGHVKLYRSYKIDEAAVALGVSIPTIRTWIKKGLPAMRTQKPYLILGADLRDFVKKIRKDASMPLALDQLLCLRCRKPRVPLGNMVDYFPRNATAGRLVGLCSVCEGTCNRFVQKTDLPKMAAIFDIICKEHGEA